MKVENKIFKETHIKVLYTTMKMKKDKLVADRKIESSKESEREKENERDKIKD